MSVWLLLLIAWLGVVPAAVFGILFVLSLPRRRRAAIADRDELADVIPLEPFARRRELETAAARVWSDHAPVA